MNQKLFLSLLALAMGVSLAHADAGGKKPSKDVPDVQPAQEVQAPAKDLSVGMADGAAKQAVQTLQGIEQLEPRELLQKDWYYDFTVYYKSCIDKQVDAILTPVKDMMEDQRYEEAYTLVASIKKCDGHKDFSDKRKYPTGVLLSNMYPGVYYKLENVDQLVDSTLQLIVNEKKRKDSLGSKIGGILHPNQNAGQSPEDILRNRFAKGEITREQFRQRTIDLLKYLYAKGDIDQAELSKRIATVVGDDPTPQS